MRIGTYDSGCGKTLYPSDGSIASSSSSVSGLFRSSTSRSHRSWLYCSGVIGAAPPWCIAASWRASGVIIPASWPGPGVAPPSAISGVAPPASIAGVASGATCKGVSSQRLRARRGVGAEADAPADAGASHSDRAPPPPSSHSPPPASVFKRFASSSGPFASHRFRRFFPPVSASFERSFSASAAPPVTSRRTASSFASRAADRASAATRSASSLCFCAIWRIVLSRSRSSCASRTRSAYDPPADAAGALSVGVSRAGERVRLRRRLL